MNFTEALRTPAINWDKVKRGIPLYKAGQAAKNGAILLVSAAAILGIIAAASGLAHSGPLQHLPKMTQGIVLGSSITLLAIIGGGLVIAKRSKYTNHHESIALQETIHHHKHYLHGHWKNEQEIKIIAKCYGGYQKELSLFQARMMRDALHPIFLTLLVGLAVVGCGLLAQHHIRYLDSFSEVAVERMKIIGSIIGVFAFCTGCFIYYKKWEYKKYSAYQPSIPQAIVVDNEGQEFSSLTMKRKLEHYCYTNRENDEALRTLFHSELFRYYYEPEEGSVYNAIKRLNDDTTFAIIREHHYVDRFIHTALSSGDTDLIAQRFSAPKYKAIIMEALKVHPGRNDKNIRNFIILGFLKAEELSKEQLDSVMSHNIWWCKDFIIALMAHPTLTQKQFSQIKKSLDEQFKDIFGKDPEIRSPQNYEFLERIIGSPNVDLDILAKIAEHALQGGHKGLFKKIESRIDEAVNDIEEWVGNGPGTIVTSYLVGEKKKPVVPVVDEEIEPPKAIPPAAPVTLAPDEAIPSLDEEVSPLDDPD